MYIVPLVGHWKEFDAMEWSSRQLKKLLEEVVLLDMPAMSLRITEVSAKGEAVINNRKNKVIRAGQVNSGYHASLNELLY